jgi:hypothetical protein
MEHQDRRALADVEVGQAQIPDVPVAGLEREVREAFKLLLGRAVNAGRRM